MALGTGVFKQTRIARQTAKGSLAATGGGRILRRTNSTFEFKKESYDSSDEINSIQQVTSVRHGVVMIDGKVDALLSPGTYADPISSILKRDFTTVTTIALGATTLATSGTGPTYTLTRSAGSWLTDGIKVGYVVRLSGSTSDNINLLVRSLTATALTVQTLNGAIIATQAATANISVSVPGRVSYVPLTGHTTVYYTVEEWMSDVPASERFGDVKFGAAKFALPGSGNATLSMSAMGLTKTTGTTAYFTAPAAETTTGIAVAASGVLLVNGVAQAVVTDLSVNVDSNLKAADGVVGSTTRPDIFFGKVKVDGSFTAYFDSTATQALFDAETQFTIISALAAGSGNADDFITITLPTVKLTSSAPDDNETGLKRTYNFTAYYQTQAAGTESTTFQIQDSAATAP
jgi:Phage tail tube protein